MVCMFEFFLLSMSEIWVTSKVGQITGLSSDCRMKKSRFVVLYVIIIYQNELDLPHFMHSGQFSKPPRMTKRERERSSRYDIANFYLEGYYQILTVNTFNFFLSVFSHHLS